MQCAPVLRFIFEKRINYMKIKEIIRKIGKFYSSIIMGNIGIFMFIGFLSVIFNEHGWFPNSDIYSISTIASNFVLPLCVAFVGGEKISGTTGGILAALGAAGCISVNNEIGILAGMISAPAGGLIWKHIGMPLKKHSRSSMQMLSGNIIAGALGCILAVSGFYIIEPVLEAITALFSYCINFLIENRMLGAISIIVEPAKILFLNNIINHGILIPIGMSGSPTLFLVETNPAPGFGILAALYLTDRKKREEYGAAMLAEAVGGIHEVYFPEVLKNLWLVIPLILSGAAGVMWFEFTGCGLTAPVSPGSFITILLMSEKTMVIKIAFGMIISGLVSFAGGVIVLNTQSKLNRLKINYSPKKEENTIPKPVEKKDEIKKPIKKIGFVCDAGVGSSVMGAALFKRKLKLNLIEGIVVEAYACDNIPPDLDIIICQKNFIKFIPAEFSIVETVDVENIMGGEEFDSLIEEIKIRNGW